MKSTLLKTRNAATAVLLGSLSLATLCGALALAALPPHDSSRPPGPKPSLPKVVPQLEVCFVLDTTSSMGNLIDGAKAKIWSIANQMIASKPTPKLKIALIAYRDRGDEYITRLFDLTGDIDRVYSDLMSFQAVGGGDGPESVNEALRDAVERVGWSADKAVLKTIFLVGDAPPHMDYSNDVKYQASCQVAARKEIVINTVQCGDQTETAPIWKEIARLAEGSYVAIGQTGGMQVVATPVDTKIAELNVELGKTLMPYGDAPERAAVVAKQVVAEAAPATLAADRLAFNIATESVVQGGGDLLDDLSAGRVQLAQIKDSELPEPLRSIPPAQRAAEVEKKLEARRTLQARAGGLLKERQAYIDSAVRNKGGSFDEKVAEIIREQTARRTAPKSHADPK